MRVLTDDDLDDFMAQAGEWLAREPVRNNVVATLLHARHSGKVPVEADLTLIRVLDRAGEVVGVAIRTPPRPMLLGELAPDAVVPLAEQVATAMPEVRGFFGPMPATRALAESVAARIGGRARKSHGSGRYVLQQVKPPVGVAGSARLAQPQDRDLLVRWSIAFFGEVGDPFDPSLVDLRLNAGLMWVWQVGGELVSVAALTEAVAGVERVNHVYTPDGSRRNGYAGALVAELATQVLRRGHMPMLYADLANPTSNRVYQAIGFEKLDECATWEIEAA